MQAGKVAGVGLAILNGSGIVYLQSYGRRNISGNLALTVMQLVQDGAIDLDKPAYHYLSKPLPEFREYKDLAGDRWKRITPRMLALPYQRISRLAQIYSRSMMPLTTRKLLIPRSGKNHKSHKSA